MSFSKYISEFKDLNEFSKEQILVLIAGKEFENLNYNLKNNNNENYFADFKSKENKFCFDFEKGNDVYNLIIQNKKDGNFEVTISNDRRSTSEEIKLDNYLKNNSKDFSSLESYIKERITYIEKDSLFNEQKELRIPPSKMNNDINNNINKDLNINLKLREINNERPLDIDNDNLRIERNIGNFGNIGYNDLHGNLPNFVPGYNNSFGRPRGNLMGPDDFGFRGPGGFNGGINYDPITPFGPKFDFIPQYDGPMKKPDNLGGNINLGMPGRGGLGFGPGFGPGFGNNFGSGGFNPFI